MFSCSTKIRMIIEVCIRDKLKISVLKVLIF